MSKSQWGSLGQALAKKETKIEKLVGIIISMMIPTMTMMTMVVTMMILMRRC